MSDGKPRGRPRKARQLAWETRVCLAEILYSFRGTYGRDADFLLAPPPPVRRVCEGLDPDLVQFCQLQAAMGENSENEGDEILMDCLLGGKDGASRCRKWIEENFAKLAVVASRMGDQTFFEQVGVFKNGMDSISAHLEISIKAERIGRKLGLPQDQIVRELIQRPEFKKRFRERAGTTPQDWIEEAYEFLCDCGPPDDPVESFRDEVSDVILRAPYPQQPLDTPPVEVVTRPPSWREIHSYLDIFQQVGVTRKQIDNLATERGWSLSNSRRFPGGQLAGPAERLGQEDDEDCG